MALNGTINGKVTNLSSYFSFYITWSATQSIEGNYSDVTAYEWIRTSSTGQTFDTVGSRSHSISIDGTTSSVSKRINCNPWGSNPLLIHSYTKRIYHNDDGTASIKISARSNGHANSWGYSASLNSSDDATVSETTITLDTIPRASSFGTVTGNTIGSAMTINVSRHADSFKHSLWYSFGSKTWQGIASNVGTSQSFTPPLSLCSEIPNATKGNLTLILRTYNGDKQVGSDVYKTIEVNVPSSVVPTIGGITVSEYVSDIASKAGVYMQGLSRLNLAIANATGAYGSTIKSYKITFEDLIWTTQSAVSGFIKGSGNLTISAEITDSRGRKGTKTMTIAVVAYSPPKFTSTPTASRQSTATNVLVTASGSVSSVKNGTTEKNVLKLYVLYKTASTSAFPSASDTYKVLDETTLSFSGATKTLTSISATSSYDIRVLIQDNFKQTYWDLELGTEIVIGDINRSGWGINKYHENGALDVGGDTYVNGNLYTNNLQHTGSHYVLKTNAGGGANGYYKFATIKVTSTYVNTPLKFSCISRDRVVGADLYVYFTSMNSTDPTLASIVYESTGSFGFYIHKSATSTWDLYYAKTQAWGYLTVVDFQGGPNGGVEVTWHNGSSDYVTTLPSGYSTAGNQMYATFALASHGHTNLVEATYGADNYPFAGVFENLACGNTKNYKSFIGSLFDGATWFNLISIRHRNGIADGDAYGMFLRSIMTGNSNLEWQQHINGTWGTVKTLLDSSNYSSYAVPKSQLKHTAIVASGSAATSASWTNEAYDFLWGIFKINGNVSYSPLIVPPYNLQFIVADETAYNQWTITLSGSTRTLSRKSGTGTLYALYGVNIV